MLKNNPLVSVIINCYNGEKYLREAIDSVINQTYDNWEIIFWDNQSTDSTAEIVRGYNDSRIHYFYAVNHTTLGEARNLAVEKANGEYINFLDVDDIWDVDKLKEQIEIVQLEHNLVVYTPFEIIVEQGVDKVMQRNYNRIRKIHRKEDHIYKDLLKHNFIIFSSVLFKKELYEKIGGINNTFQQNEDYELLLKCALLSDFSTTKISKTYYRIHKANNSITNGIIGLYENREIFNGLPDSKEQRKAIYYNEARIGYFMILNEKKYISGIKHILNESRLKCLLNLIVCKIDSYF